MKFFVSPMLSVKTAWGFFRVILFVCQIFCVLLQQEIK